MLESSLLSVAIWIQHEGQAGCVCHEGLTGCVCQGFAPGSLRTKPAIPCQLGHAEVRMQGCWPRLSRPAHRILLLNPHPNFQLYPDPESLQHQICLPQEDILHEVAFQAVGSGCIGPGGCRVRVRVRVRVRSGAGARVRDRSRVKGLRLGKVRVWLIYLYPYSYPYLYLYLCPCIICICTRTPVPTPKPYPIPQPYTDLNPSRDNSSETQA